MQPWLDVYRNRRVLIMFGLGFSSGLPLALTGSTLQAWMMSEGVDLSVIGIFSLVGLPYTLKMLWSPFMDRYTPSWMGRRRGWILIMQLALTLCILGLGGSSPAQTPWITASLALAVAFFSASQDIAVDAYRADVLGAKELGAGAATTVVGYRIAMLTSGAVALILSDHLPWNSVYTLMAILMLTNMAFTFLAPEPQVAVAAPKTLREAVWNPLASYFRRSNAVEMLLFIAVFKMGDAIAGAMTTPFLLDLGFTRTDVATVNKAFGLISTILGTLAGGSLISKLGVNRSLWIFAFLQAISNLSFTVLAMVGKSYSGMVATVAIENICAGMATAGFMAFLMSLCDKRFTATQYALLSSLMAVTRVLAGAPTGYMAKHLGWIDFFTLSVLGAVPGILLLFRFAPWRAAEAGAGTNVDANTDTELA